MDSLKEMWGRLPKWAKIGVPVLVVAIAAYIYVKDKGSSSTLSEPASGTPDEESVGASTTPTTTTTTTLPPAVTPAAPAAAPQSAAWDALANHWGAQARLNASREGKTAPKNVEVVGPNATTAQAKAAYEHNKTVATTIAQSKSRAVPAVKVTKNGKR